MGGDTIEIENLRYCYPDGTEALCGMNLSIPLHRRTVLLGANGCGKSTLIRHLNGLIVPQEGSVRIGDRELNNKTADELRKKVGLLFDNPDNQLFSPSVQADVSFGPSNLRWGKKEIEQRVMEAMETVKIVDLKDRSPYNLSLGQKKRCAIAGVLAMNPEILLMDEPFSGLDPASLELFLETLEVLYENGMTQIISTHDVDIAYEWAEYVVVLGKGKVLATGSRELMQDASVMRKAGLVVPLLVRLFEGKEKIPKNFSEAREMLWNR